MQVGVGARDEALKLWVPCVRLRQTLRIGLHVKWRECGGLCGSPRGPFIIFNAIVQCHAMDTRDIERLRVSSYRSMRYLWVLLVCFKIDDHQLIAKAHHSTTTPTRGTHGTIAPLHDRMKKRVSIRHDIVFTIHRSSLPLHISKMTSLHQQSSRPKENEKLLFLNTAMFAISKKSSMIES